MQSGLQSARVANITAGVLGSLLVDLCADGSILGHLQSCSCNSDLWGGCSCSDCWAGYATGQCTGGRSGSTRAWVALRIESERGVMQTAK